MKPGAWTRHRWRVYDLQMNTAKALFRGGSDARYVTSGHLVYTAQGALRAVPFDLRRLALSGTPVTVGRGWPRSQLPDSYGVAANGTLVYVAIGARPTDGRLSGSIGSGERIRSL